MQDDYLFDASAIFSLIQHSEVIDKIPLSRIHILHLIIYEVRNALWKETYLLRKISDPDRVINDMQRLLRHINVLGDLPLTEVFKVVTDRGLTFYNASYVYVAESISMKLVTNGKKVLKSSGNAISYTDFIQLITMRNFNYRLRKPYIAIFPYS
ncbi:type II toxin-antitoxin system VapC family toxin [Caldivirga sp.]|uniref:type II toxin-antitoxin system VapC family toxin n=1 Tax=Caldivirga sp. TaxID=2080243 RepID=UPI003D0AE3EF